MLEFKCCRCGMKFKESKVLFDYERQMNFCPLCKSYDLIVVV